MFWFKLNQATKVEQLSSAWLHLEYQVQYNFNYPNVNYLNSQLSNSNLVFTIIKYTLSMSSIQIVLKISNSCCTSDHYFKTVITILLLTKTWKQIVSLSKNCIFDFMWKFYCILVLSSLKGNLTLLYHLWLLINHPPWFILEPCKFCQVL